MNRDHDVRIEIRGPMFQGQSPGRLYGVILTYGERASDQARSCLNRIVCRGLRTGL